MNVILHPNGKFEKTESPFESTNSLNLLGDIEILFSKRDDVFNPIAKTILENNGVNFGWNGDVAFRSISGNMTEEQYSRVDGFLRLLHALPVR